jgi:acetate kinase
VQGLAGTSDMREVVAEGGLAFDVYVHTLVRHIGAMAASLDGLDALAFTAGVGENSPEVRAATTSRLTHLAPFPTLVIPAREDIEITHQVTALLA